MAMEKIKKIIFACGNHGSHWQRLFTVLYFLVILFDR